MENRPEVTDTARRGQSGSALPAGSGRQLYLHGVRTATFRAEDPNGDRLRYRISYRRQGDVPWQPFRSALSETIVAWGHLHDARRGAMNSGSRPRIRLTTLPAKP